MNYWLDRCTEPEITQAANTGHEVDGKWYVSKKVKDKWPSDDVYYAGFAAGFCDGSSPDVYYLHSDGTWCRNSTMKDNKWSGYYDTKEEAEAMLKKVTLKRHDR